MPRPEKPYEELDPFGKLLFDLAENLGKKNGIDRKTDGVMKNREEIITRMQTQKLVDFFSDEEVSSLFYKKSKKDGFTGNSIKQILGQWINGKPLTKRVQAEALLNFFLKELAPDDENERKQIEKQFWSLLHERNSEITDPWIKNEKRASAETLQYFRILDMDPRVQPEVQSLFYNLARGKDLSDDIKALRKLHQKNAQIRIHFQDFNDFVIRAVLEGHLRSGVVKVSPIVIEGSMAEDLNCLRSDDKYDKTDGQSTREHVQNLLKYSETISRIWNTIDPKLILLKRVMVNLPGDEGTIANLRRRLRGTFNAYLNAFGAADALIKKCSNSPDYAVTGKPAAVFVPNGLAGACLADRISGDGVLRIFEKSDSGYGLQDNFFAFAFPLVRLKQSRAEEHSKDRMIDGGGIFRFINTKIFDAQPLADIINHKLFPISDFSTGDHRKISYKIGEYIEELNKQKNEIEDFGQKVFIHTGIGISDYEDTGHPFVMGADFERRDISKDKKTKDIAGDFIYYVITKASETNGIELFRIVDKPLPVLSGVPDEPYEITIPLKKLTHLALKSSSNTSISVSVNSSKKLRFLSKWARGFTVLAELKEKEVRKNQPEAWREKLREAMLPYIIPAHEFYVSVETEW